MKPYWGKPTVRNFRGGRGNVMHGLAAICHEARKGGYNGSRRPTHRRASPLLDPEPHNYAFTLFRCSFACPSPGAGALAFGVSARGIAVAASALQEIFASVPQASPNHASGTPTPRVTASQRDAIPCGFVHPAHGYGAACQSSTPGALLESCTVRTYACARNSR